MTHPLSYQQIAVQVTGCVVDDDTAPGIAARYLMTLVAVVVPSL